MSLKIDFYCDEKYQNMIPEPVESAKFFPKWFSDLPLYKEEKKLTFSNNNIYDVQYDKSGVNIKKCVAVNEFLKNGYLIPSWADFIFREQDDGSLYINWLENNYKEMTYKVHLESQYYTMPNKPIYGHFGKIFTPWTIKTSKGVSCLITHPVWHNNKMFTSSTAVFHTDASPLNLAWFFEWNYKIKTKMQVDNMDLENQIIEKGEPIILIIPFYRKKYSHNVNYVSEKEIEKLQKTQLKLTQNTSNSKCPYTEFRKNLGKLF